MPIFFSFTVFLIHLSLPLKKEEEEEIHADVNWGLKHADFYKYI